MSKRRTISLFEAACHPERSEGSHISCARHTNVPRVINDRTGGPSPSARLGMTA